jgi:putative oxidoreductase
MNIALWIVQALLVCAFTFAAGLKLFAFDMMAAQAPGIAGLHGLFIFIAMCELAGSAGLVLPMLTRIYPVLTAWAAAGLAAIAFLAGIFHLYRGEYSELPGAIGLGLLALFVVWGRGFRAVR